MRYFDDDQQDRADDGACDEPAEWSQLDAHPQHRRELFHGLTPPA